MDYSYSFAQSIISGAARRGQRTGQFLFNCLPNEVTRIIVDEKNVYRQLDTHAKDLSAIEILGWVENHLIFDDHGEILCFFDGDDILWELSPPDMAVAATVVS